MQTALTSLLIVIAIASSGCRSTGMLAKREAEKCCPTDIRQSVPWCAGEDAIFHCPCQPSSDFYGHKPTCWGTWPASGNAWRTLYCGDQHHQAVITEHSRRDPELILLPEVPSAPTPPAEPKTPAEQSIQLEIAPPPPVEDPVEEMVERSEPKPAETNLDEDLPEPSLGPIRLPYIDAE